MPKRRATLTVGIAALNEEQNLGNLLTSILTQVQETFTLERIVVVSDGSTDGTNAIVRSFHKQHSFIELVAHTARKGKNTRVNEIFHSCTSDILLLLDADILLGSLTDLQAMVTEMQADPRCCLVGARHIPVTTNRSLPARILRSNYLLWTEVHLPLNGGDNVYNVYGSAMMLAKKLYSELKLPKNITCDTGYIYGIAHEIGTFRTAMNTMIYQNPSETFAEFRKVFFRTTNEKQDLHQFFDQDLNDFYAIPRRSKLKAIITRMRKDPIFTPLAVATNLLVRFFPYQDTLTKNGMWEILASTKKGINPGK